MTNGALNSLAERSAAIDRELLDWAGLYVFSLRDGEHGWVVRFVQSNGSERRAGGSFRSGLYGIREALAAARAKWQEMEEQAKCAGN